MRLIHKIILRIFPFLKKFVSRGHSKIRVFVSSTFHDLVDCRTAVINVIDKLEGEAKVMERTGARTDPPKKESIRIIKKESDIFVGIYARRYGSVPKGDKISITEAEYYTAKKAKLPTLIYLNSTDFPEIYFELSDEKDAKIKLSEFKKKLQRNHICEFFSSEEDLAEKATGDLKREFKNLDPNYGKQYKNILDPKREARLKNDLKSDDSIKVTETIEKILESKPAWLFDEIRKNVLLPHMDLPKDRNVAKTVISALKEIGGDKSAKVIVRGLNSRFKEVRDQAALSLGEMGLKQRNHIRSVISDLIDASQNPANESDTLGKIIHAICKIGGNKAYDALINILKSNKFSAAHKATALHGVDTFWKDFEKVQREEFIKEARLIIMGWSKDTCREIKKEEFYHHLTYKLTRAVNKNLQS